MPGTSYVDVRCLDSQYDRDVVTRVLRIPFALTLCVRYAYAMATASGCTVPWRAASGRTVPWRDASGLSWFRPKSLVRLVHLDALDAILFFPDVVG